MKWKYHYTSEWINGNSSPAQSMFLRPVITRNDEILHGKIIELELIAVEYFMSDKLKDQIEDTDLAQIYSEKLKAVDYYLVENEVLDKDVYIASVTMYVKKETLTPESILDWVKVYFKCKKIPFELFEETVFDEFVDTDPFLKLFNDSAKNLQSSFGEEWWKKD
jgi:hypothetical protein